MCNVCNLHYRKLRDYDALMTTEMQSMPVLKNARHEAFCQARAKGETIDQAYQTAGYRANRGNACELNAKECIRDRVTELQSRITAKAVDAAAITKADLMRMLLETRQAAHDAGQNAAAVSAIRELGVLTGDRIERAEQGQPGGFSDKTDDEINSRLETLLGGNAEDEQGRQARSAGAAGRKGSSGKSSRLH